MTLYHLPHMSKPALFYRTENNLEVIECVLTNEPHLCIERILKRKLILSQYLIMIKHMQINMSNPTPSYQAKYKLEMPQKKQLNEF